jgi:putative membrane protein
MMEGMNNGWGMGFGYSWIIGLIVLIVVIWLVFKVVNKNKK